MFEHVSENICDITCELILSLRRPIKACHVDLVGIHWGLSGGLRLS